MAEQFGENNLHILLVKFLEPYGDEDSPELMTFADKNSQETASCRRSALLGFSFHGIAG
jgi:hypothetical protein